MHVKRGAGSSSLPINNIIVHVNWFLMNYSSILQLSSHTAIQFVHVNMIAVHMSGDVWSD